MFLLEYSSPGRSSHNRTIIFLPPASILACTGNRIVLLTRLHKSESRNFGKLTADLAQGNWCRLKKQVPHVPLFWIATPDFHPGRNFDLKIRGPSHLAPFPFPLQALSFFLHSPSASLNPSRGLRSAAVFDGEWSPSRNRIWCISASKSDILATTLMIFLIINWPNFTLNIKHNSGVGTKVFHYLHVLSVGWR